MSCGRDVHEATRKVRETARILRKHLPLKRRVVIRRVWLTEEDDAFADTDLVRGRFVIRIHSGLTGSLARYFLVHEWAHARSWPLAGEDEEHCPHFGVEYGRCHSLIYDGKRY